MRGFVSKGETARRIESLNQLVEEALALALVGTRQHGVRTSLDLDYNLLPVLVDPVQIQQVILNLARNAVEALQPVFDNAGNENISSKTIRDSHLAALNGGKIRKDLTTGAGAEALKNGKLIERLYNVPYLAHAPMEPPNATALYKKDGTLEVWSGTQDGLGSRAFCAKAAGLSLDKVTFHLLPSGGGFGRPRS